VTYIAQTHGNHVGGEGKKKKEERKKETRKREEEKKKNSKRFFIFFFFFFFFSSFLSNKILSLSLFSFPFPFPFPFFFFFFSSSLPLSIAMRVSAVAFLGALCATATAGASVPGADATAHVRVTSAAAAAAADNDSGEAPLSFREAARRGPFGFADYLDLERLGKLHKQLAEDDVLIEGLRRKYGDTRMTGDPAKPFESAATSVSGGADVLVSATASKADKAADLAAIREAVRDEVRSAVQSEVSKSVAAGMAALAAKAKEVRENPFGEFKPWRPAEGTTLLADADAGGCAAVTVMDECFERPVCKWTMNVGCAPMPCEQHKGFENCAATGSGCKWVINEADHDQDRCVALSQQEVATLLQQGARVTSTKAVHGKDIDADFVHATQELMARAEAADNGKAK
jgi:hypothetical protein